MSDEDEESGSITLERPEEEALRLKTLAEEKYKSGNLNSALNYAMRAHELHPSVNGLSEMLTAFKILLAAAASPEKSTPDYYRILQAERFSHINSVKKNYKKLALTLHPDKNPSAASEEAFKLVGEAARVLSDKLRRKDYDMKLRIAMQSEATEEVGLGTEETFWTACSACRLLHQFERKYLGHNLMCPRCKKTFKAMEVEDDRNNGVGEGQTRVSARIRERVAKGEHAGVVEKFGLGVKRRVTRKKKVENEEFKLKKVRKDGGAMNEIRLTGKSDGVGIVERERTKGAEDSDDEEEETMTLSQMRIMMKKKLVEGKLPRKEMQFNEAKEKEEGCGEKEKETEKKKDKGMKSVTMKRVSKDRRLDALDHLHSKIVKKGNVEEEKKIESTREKRERRRVSKYGNLDLAKTNTSRLMANEKDSLEIMPVEDSDFNDFDKDRTEKSFKKGQVWAVYDDDDGMPRHYGLIDRVVSLNPFQVTFIWLRFHSNKDEKLLSWPNTGCHVSCGIFQVSRKVTIKFLNLFSHLVDCERATKELYRIYPKKGSVWAMYNSSDPPQAQETIIEDTRSYDIVVSLSSYSDIHGVSIGYLEKVAGFRAVFKRREVGANGVICLGPKDVKLLSHQIPAKKLSGRESTGLPKDCWELDPASLTPNLLVTS